MVADKGPLYVRVRYLIQFEVQWGIRSIDAARTLGCYLHSASPAMAMWTAKMLGISGA